MKKIFNFLFIYKDLFERLQNNGNQLTGYRTEVSYLEIYNEKVRDLLRSSRKFAYLFKILFKV